MLLLDTSVEDERRAKILADVEQTIADAGGSVELKQAWGMRRLAYEIDHKGDAEYDLLQFTGPAALVETLSYNLKIADGVVRHRIIKVLPGTPPAPEPAAAEPAVAAEAPAATESTAPIADEAPADEAAAAEAPAVEPAVEAPEAVAEPADDEPTEAPAAS
jgi:small subunit ribosomal protein S6